VRALVVVLASILTFVAACASHASEVQPSGQPAPATQSGGFNGVYRTEYVGDEQVWNGKPSPAELAARQYAFRSTCETDGCVATGIRLDDGDTGKVYSDDGKDVPPVTLDHVGDQWLWAAQYPFTCDEDGSSGRQFVAWSVTPQPDGKLTGTRVDARFASPVCTGVFEVPLVMTRVGDVAATTPLPDPAAAQARKPTPPEGLSGHYGVASTPRQLGGESSTLPAVFTSYCVRSTDNCVALERFTGSSGTQAVNALEFGDGRWTLTYQGGEVTCPYGGKATRETYVEFTMPTPAAAPLEQLTGRQRSSYTGSCLDVDEWDLVAKRAPG
jgi:hypothetical protein